MKKLTLKASLAILLCSSIVGAQELIFKKNQELHIQNILSQNESIIKQKKSKDYNFGSIDKTVYKIQSISDQIKTTPNFDFFQGLQSPYDTRVWIYLEREQIGGAFNVIKVDLKSNQQTILLSNKNKDRKDLALKPIAWTKNPNKIFVEALYLDAAEIHEGIFTYDLKNGELEKLTIPFGYIRTPLLSPERDRFIFSGTLEKNADHLHNISDIVYEYNIKTTKSRTIIQSKGEDIALLGWNQVTKKKNEELITQKSLLSYYLPWDFGKEYCVSRHGTPGPTQSHTPVGQCGGFGPGGHHGYSAIDFATSLSGDDNVRASAAGTVSFSGISGSLSSGYGRLVIIRHSDGTRTYYAHNKTLLVRQGQTVKRGQIIALEGTTGGSTGDHIHFEWRAAGGNASTPGSFVDAGQPRQNFRYRSQNTTALPPPPADTTAPTTSISATGGTTQAGDFTANFNDRDNVGVTRRYYQVMEKYGDNWFANRGNGFFNDNYGNFYSGYVVGSGNWSISNKHLRQSNTAAVNTNLSSFLSQKSGLPYLYEFSAKVVSTSGPRKFGIHIMADNTTLSQRGNSYLIWFSGEDNKVRIYETVNNVLNFRAIDDVPLDNKWASYKITYSPAFGVIEIFKNNTSVLRWTDTTPIASGSGISLRTNATIMEFDDLKVYKFRAGSSLSVAAGTGVTKDIRRRNGKIKSVVRDAAGNWSTPGNLDVTISSLTRQNDNLIDDTDLEIDIDSDIKISPNPTDGTNVTLKYETQSKTSSSINIFDITGRVLQSFSNFANEPGTRSIDLSPHISSLQNGQYFISIETNGNIKTISIIKN